jgi:excisionase family DNA binding protein
METETRNKLLTISEVVSELRIGRNKVYEFIHKGVLRAYRLNEVGRKRKYSRKPWRVKQSDLEEFISRGSNKPTKQGELHTESLNKKVKSVL